MITVGQVYEHITESATIEIIGQLSNHYVKVKKIGGKFAVGYVGQLSEYILTNGGECSTESFICYCDKCHFDHICSGKESNRFRLNLAVEFVIEHGIYTKEELFEVLL